MNACKKDTGEMKILLGDRTKCCKNKRMDRRRETELRGIVQGLCTGNDSGCGMKGQKRWLVEELVHKDC